MKKTYDINKSEKVGTVCKCPSCGTEFIKTNYQQVFCKSKKGTTCKDKYWNTVTPNKRNNTTRISKANSSYYHNVILPKRVKEQGFPTVYDKKNYIVDDDSFTVTTEICEFCNLRAEFCICDDLIY